MRRAPSAQGSFPCGPAELHGLCCLAYERDASWFFFQLQNDLKAIKCQYDLGIISQRYDLSVIATTLQPCLLRRYELPCDQIRELTIGDVAAQGVAFLDPSGKAGAALGFGLLSFPANGLNSGKPVKRPSKCLALSGSFFPAAFLKQFILIDARLRHWAGQ